MLDKYPASPQRNRAHRDCSSESLLAEFAQWLGQIRYAESTVGHHLRAAKHYLYWAEHKGTLANGFDEASLRDYDQHLSQCRCSGFGHTPRYQWVRGARLLLEFARTGVGGTPVEIAADTDPVLLTAFCHWMRTHRGTGDATLYNYRIPLRALLQSLGDDPGRFDAQGLRQFVVERSRNQGSAATGNCTVALRMFLRFLIAEGRCSANLEAAVPVVAHWSLGSLPRYLQAEEVERVILACDSSSPVGIRDRAIMLLLARMGLRAGDICRLQLGDIDWKEACIAVIGKGRRQTQLPLTQEVGQAIVEYLQQARPTADTDAVFIRSQAPFRAFGNSATVSSIVANAMRRAGVKCPSRGAAHVLRHSVATELLRKGASLQDIAAVLRHRSVETTTIYAKVDVPALRQIVQPWPEIPTC